VTVQPETTQESQLPALPPVRARLNQPRRALIGLAELVAGALLVWLAFWLWSKASVTVVQVLEDGRPPYRLYGNWMALAILCGTVTAVLVIDAWRQFMLAFRARPRAKGRRRK
jgi:fatty acid desaturase